MQLPSSVFSLKGVVQHYSWGGFSYIPSLIGKSNENRQPFAEYWLGAHPNYPSLTDASDLATLIAQDTTGLLGDVVLPRFGSLPFLLKILDVRQMLSIQVHPAREAAAKGFDREEAMGIPRNAPHRNYKDRNHKPELMVALSEFWLLHGFKPEAELRTTLDTTPAFASLRELFAAAGYAGLYQTVMNLEQEEVDDMLRPLVEPLLQPYRRNTLEKSDPGFWAARAYIDLCNESYFDRGIFSIYFFNLVQLAAGEGIYQGAGLPHAYLEGQNIEVMANSDNVLRAGLTEKHIDIPELMLHVKFEATHPHILRPGDGPCRIYHSPAEEFELSVCSADAGEKRLAAPQIWLVLEGQLEIHAGKERLQVGRGESLFLSPGQIDDFNGSPDLSFVKVTVPEA